MSLAAAAERESRARLHGSDSTSLCNMVTASRADFSSYDWYRERETEAESMMDYMCSSEIIEYGRLVVVHFVVRNLCSKKVRRSLGKGEQRG